jgi:hypothetical protein
MVAHPAGWLVKSVADLGTTPLPPHADGELAELKALLDKRSAADVERALWWDAGGPAYRWNEIAIEEMLKAPPATSP